MQSLAEAPSQRALPLVVDIAVSLDSGREWAVAELSDRIVYMGDSGWFAMPSASVLALLAVVILCGVPLAAAYWIVVGQQKFGAKRKNNKEV